MVFRSARGVSSRVRVVSSRVRGVSNGIWGCLAWCHDRAAYEKREYVSVFGKWDSENLVNWDIPFQ